MVGVAGRNQRRRGTADLNARFLVNHAGPVRTSDGAKPTHGFVLPKSRGDKGMRRASLLASAVAVLVLVLLAPAQAAPIGGAAGNLSEITGENADIIKVRHRCYWHRGHWHCPRHRHYQHYY